MLDFEIPQNFTLIPFKLIFNELCSWKMQIKKADFDVKSALKRRERDKILFSLLFQERKRTEF